MLNHFLTVEEVLLKNHFFNRAASQKKLKLSKISQTKKTNVKSYLSVLFEII